MIRVVAMDDASFVIDNKKDGIPFLEISSHNDYHDLFALDYNTLWQQLYLRGIVDIAILQSINHIVEAIYPIIHLGATNAYELPSGAGSNDSTKHIVKLLVRQGLTHLINLIDCLS